MATQSEKNPPLVYARVAGALYLIIIVCGLFAEGIVRTRLVVPEDAAATAANIVASAGLFRIGFLADSLMILSDVALAGLLYLLFIPVSRVLSLIALCFRLAQSAVLALNLLNSYAAILVLNNGAYASEFDPGQLASLSYLFLQLHSHGYDLGLLLFGIHCLLLGILILKSSFLPRILGVLTIGASGAYLIGSLTRFLFPGFVPTVAPVYIVALVAELSLCLWLLVKGVDVQARKEMAGSPAAS